MSGDYQPGQDDSADFQQDALSTPEKKATEYDPHDNAKPHDTVARGEDGDLTFLTDAKGMVDAITKRNSDFHVMVDVARMIKARMEALNDTMLEMRQALDGRVDSNIDEIIKALNDLVETVRVHNAEGGPNGKKTKDLLNAMSSWLDKQKFNLKKANEDEKTPQLETPINPQTSAALDFAGAPTGDNWEYKKYEKMDKLNVEGWQNAIKGRNENFQELVEVYEILFGMSDALVKNYNLLQTTYIEDADADPDALDPLKWALNQLLEVLASQDKSEESKTIQALRKRIGEARDKFDADTKATAKAETTIKSSLTTSKFSNMRMNPGAAATGINPDKKTLEGDEVGDEEKGSTVLAKDKIVQAIQQRNVNFVSLVDAAYDLMHICKEIERGLKKLLIETKKDKPMRAGTIALINDLYSIYTTLGGHADPVNDRPEIHKKEILDLKNGVRELYKQAKTELSGPIKPEAPPESVDNTPGTDANESAASAGNQDVVQSKRAETEEEQRKYLQETYGTSPAASSLSDRTAHLSERVVRLEAKTRAAASELLQSNPSGVPVARSSLGSRSGHSRNGKHYKLNLAF